VADPRIAEAFVEIRPDTSGFRRATQTQVKTQLAGVGTGLTSAGIGLRGVSTGALLAGSGVAALTTAVGVLGVRTARAAIDFESSFAGVRKTVDATEREFAELSAGFRELARTIPVNVNELNKIGELGGQLGIANTALLGFTDTIAKLGVTTNLTTESAATALARFANITGTAQEDFDRIGSTIVDLGNNFATTEAEIAEFALRIAGAGDIVGLTESTILAIGAALSSIGVEAEAGGTAVQKVLLSMQKAADLGGKSLNAFAQATGLTTQQFKALFDSDPTAAFLAFVEGLKQAEASGGSAQAVLQDLGLTDQRLTRAFLSIANSGDLLRRTIDLGSEAWEENIALTEEAEKRFETTASQIQLFKNNVNDLAISLGNRLLPVIQSSLGGLNGFVDGLRTGEGAGGGFLKDLTPAIDGIKKAFAALRPDAERLVGVIKRNIETWVIFIRVTQPIRVLIFGALIVAIKAAIRIIDILSLTVNALAEAFVKSVQFIVGAIEKFLGGMSFLADAASAIPGIGGMFDGVSDKINAARENLRTFSDGLDGLDGKTVTTTVNVRIGREGEAGSSFGDPFRVGREGTAGSSFNVPVTGTTGGGGGTRESQVPTPLRAELTSLTRAREQRLLDEAELASLTEGIVSDDRRALAALIAFYKELANSDRFTVAAKRAFLIEQKRAEGELARVNADAAQASKDAAEEEKSARQDELNTRAAERLSLLQINLQLAGLTKLRLSDDRAAYRDLIAYWTAQAKLKGATLVEIRTAQAEARRYRQELKALNRQETLDEIADREDLLRDNVTLAQLNEKSTRDDAKALRKLIAFYAKQARNKKLSRDERRDFLIKQRQAEKELRDLTKSESGTIRNFSQQAFGFLQDLNGFTANLAGNLLTAPLGFAGATAGPAAQAETFTPKLPRLPTSPGARGGAEGVASGAAGAEALRERRGQPATYGQMEVLLRRTSRGNELLADIRRGTGHPEAKHTRAASRHAVETGVD
jgi:TP901 family phage tail tape measure protein